MELDIADLEGLDGGAARRAQVCQRRNREIERKLANVNWGLVVGLVVAGVLVVVIW